MAHDHRDNLVPFTPGNTASLKYGAHSPRVVAVMSAIVRDEVVDLAPWLTQPIFADALMLYCRAEAHARLINDHIFKVADEQGAHHIPVRLIEGAVACDNAASRAADRLGLTPMARAKLAQITTTTDVATESLARLADTGKAIRARRKAELDANPDDPAPDGTPPDAA